MTSFAYQPGKAASTAVYRLTTQPTVAYAITGQNATLTKGWILNGSPQDSYTYSKTTITSSLVLQSLLRSGVFFVMAGSSSTRLLRTIVLPVDPVPFVENVWDQPEVVADAGVTVDAG